MRKFKILLTVLALISISAINAQPNPEKKAKKFTDEMTEVLSLNEEESKAIYEIQLERFKTVQSLKKEYANDPKTLKEKQKALGNEVFNKVKNVLGKERQQKWKDYKSNN